MKRIHWQPPVPLLLVLLLAAAAACSPISRRPSPATATAQSQRAFALATHMAQGLLATRQAGELSAAATAQANQERLVSASNWPVLLADSFDSEGAGWPSGSESDPLAEIEWIVAGGRYRWIATALDSFVWWTTPGMDPIEDFYLAVTVQQLSGPGEGEAGLVFRLDSETSRYYLYEIDNSGDFALFYHDTGAWETLIDWQASPAIQNAAANRIALFAQGDEFLLLANDRPVATWQDGRLGSGQVGLLIGLSQAGTQGVWEFDDFELRAP